MTEVITKSPKETYALGRKFSKRLKGGDIVAFSGGLGSGKTCFIKGVCKGLSVKETPVSPSFTIINEYTGIYKVYHIDLYRISDSEELQEIGFEDILYGTGVCLIEWADKIKNVLPEKQIYVNIEFVNDNNFWRKIQITSNDNSGN